MKNILERTRLPVFTVILVLVSFISVGSGRPGKMPRNNVPASGILAFNLAPDKANIGFSISGTSFTNVPLTYKDFTGGYQPIYPGERTIEAYDFKTGTTVAVKGSSFEKGKYYSSFLVGSNGNYENIIVDDNLEKLDGTKVDAYIRYVNAIPATTDKTIVQFTAKGIPVLNEPSPFKTVSGFTAVEAGNLSVSVNDGSTINATQNIELEPNAVYTVLLVGLVGEYGPGGVQIKIVRNGTITSNK